MKKTNCWRSDQFSMRERGQFGAYLGKVIEVDFGCNDSRTVRKLGQDFPPGIDNHRVAMGFEAFWIRSELIWGHDVDLIFDGPRSQQRLPMGLSRVGGKYK